MTTIMAIKPKGRVCAKIWAYLMANMQITQ